MKKVNALLIAILFIAVWMTTNSCKNGKKEKSNTQMQSIDSIYTFQHGNVAAHASVNLALFTRYYNDNPDRWIKAFNFFREHDVSKLDIGRYKLDGDNLFVNIDEYDTKDEQDCKYESHKKYADIQYLVYGQERIGVARSGDLEVNEPYKPDKDIMFYKAPLADVYHLADSSRFFIFFPDNLHRPCVKVQEKQKVRKAVVKVRVD